MNIQDVRQKFPQYEDLSDQELATALHGKFYSDIPFPQFAQQIGLGAPVPKKSDFSIGEMVSNIPRSAVGVGQDMIAPFFSPIETAKSLGNLGLGLGSKLVSGGLPEEKYAEALGGMIKQRYGSGGAALKTLEKDPVGVVSDVAGLLTGGGLAAGKIPGLVKAGQGATKVGAAIDPLNLALNTGMYAAGKLTPKGSPASMYESAAKFSTTLSPQERAQLVQTALDEQLAPTAAGVQKAQNLINQIDSEVSTLIADAQASGKKIPRSAVFKYVNETKKKLLEPGMVEAAQDRAKINDILTGYITELNKGKVKDFTPEAMQRIKRDVYKRINYDRDLMQSPGVAREETYKAMGRGMREGIERVAPKVGPLNAREGRLIELMQPLQRAAGRIENRDLIGIGAPIKMGTGASVGGSTGAVIAAAQSLLDNPKLKANTALKLYDLQRKGAGQFSNNSINSLLLRQLLEKSGAYQQGLEE